MIIDFHANYRVQYGDDCHCGNKLICVPGSQFSCFRCKFDVNFAHHTAWSDAAYIHNVSIYSDDVEWCLIDPTGWVIRMNGVDEHRVVNMSKPRNMQDIMMCMKRIIQRLKAKHIRNRPDERVSRFVGMNWALPLRGDPIRGVI